MLGNTTFKIMFLAVFGESYKFKSGAKGKKHRAHRCCTGNNGESTGHAGHLLNTAKCRQGHTVISSQEHCGESIPNQIRAYSYLATNSRHYWNPETNIQRLFPTPASFLFPASLCWASESFRFTQVPGHTRSPQPVSLLPLTTAYRPVHTIPGPVLARQTAISLSQVIGKASYLPEVRC